MYVVPLRTMNKWMFGIYHSKVKASTSLFPWYYDSDMFNFLASYTIYRCVIVTKGLIHAIIVLFYKYHYNTIELIELTHNFHHLDTSSILSAACRLPYLEEQLKYNCNLTPSQESCLMWTQRDHQYYSKPGGCYLELYCLPGSCVQST